MKVVFDWGQPGKSIPIGDEDDSEEYSFLLKDEGAGECEEDAHFSTG